MLPHLSPAAWLVCIITVILTGMAKGGFAGLGALATPVVALALPPAMAAAVVLPLLILQDVISVWSFRREWSGWIVAWMLPGAILGIVLGYAYAAYLDERALTGMIGTVTLAFGVYRLWIERGGRVVAASNSPGWVGSLFGVVTGLASHISHSGAPPYQMWVTPRQLPHMVYAGTTAVLFAAINWLKVPSYLALGLLTSEVLSLAAVLYPLAVASTLVSVAVVRRLDSERFYRAIYYLMIALGGKLILDGFAT